MGGGDAGNLKSNTLHLNVEHEVGNTLEEHFRLCNGIVYLRN